MECFRQFGLSPEIETRGRPRPKGASGPDCHGLREVVAGLGLVR